MRRTRTFAGNIDGRGGMSKFARVTMSTINALSVGALLMVFAACSPASPESDERTGRSGESAQVSPRDEAPSQPQHEPPPPAPERERAAEEIEEPSPPHAATQTIPPVAREPAQLPEEAPSTPAPSPVPVPVPQPEAGMTDLAVSVMTFNIRYATDSDGPDRWELRSEHAIDVMRRDRPDFLGLQEVRPVQRTQIAQAMPEWEMFGRGAGRAADRGDASPILYLRERWRLDEAEQGFFWLSETPEVVGSQGWDAALPRLVTFGRFIERTTGRAVYVFNTHFDHRGATARERSAALLAERVAMMAERAPVIVMGDFNVGADGSAMAPLREIGLIHSLRAYRTANPNDIPPGTSGTFHGFAGRPRSAIIDAIFVPEGSVVEHAEVITESREDRFPSDHFPVTLRVRLRSVR